MYLISSVILIILLLFNSYTSATKIGLFDSSLTSCGLYTAASGYTDPCCCPSGATCTTIKPNNIDSGVICCPTGLVCSRIQPISRPDYHRVALSRSAAPLAYRCNAMGTCDNAAALEPSFLPSIMLSAAVSLAELESAATPAAASQSTTSVPSFTTSAASNPSSIPSFTPSTPSSTPYTIKSPTSSHPDTMIALASVIGALALLIIIALVLLYLQFRPRTWDKVELDDAPKTPLNLIPELPGEKTPVETGLGELWEMETESEIHELPAGRWSRVSAGTRSGRVSVGRFRG
ncbi:hypothetical protein BU16DRAFT_543941 [Lophium mytilinum]|uniref:Uncharacterized protein n=1 Tax=Lophium mytilinum TaxID=390894 RepID=A0A6A6QEU9_9PEZI|nr:hypothetical protein BU16DRAFT_543941 [Lophium mytilinum]